MNLNTISNNSYHIPNGVSRALQEANDRKARKLTFYKNGEPFSNAITISILPGRDFRTMDQLCIYLTDKIKIANGVQYIFTTNGERILTLNELEHGQTYVVSGLKGFQRYPYGQINKLKQMGTHSQGVSYRTTAFREDDLKLLRPLSSKFNSVYHNINQAINTSYKEGRIITIVNNKDHKIRSRVLLNLKSPKSFDIIVKDLGQAVRIKNAKRMFTASGHEVRSVSQLKRDMIGIELFYLESSRSTSKSPPNQLKSYSLESINQMNKTKHSKHYFNSSNDYIHSITNRISRNESNPEMNVIFDYKRQNSSNFSDINPSRRGESSLSERISLNMESMAENDYQIDSKASETQTSPDFVKTSRKNAKKIMKIEREKSEQGYHSLNDEIEERINQRVLINHLTHLDKTPTHIQNKNPDLSLNRTSNHNLISMKKTNEIQKSPKHKKRDINKTKANEVIKHKNPINDSTPETNDTLRRDALQEYAETLLRETAFLVQNEALIQESVEKIREEKKIIKSTPKRIVNQMTPNKSSKTSPMLPKTEDNYVNEVKNKNKVQTETEEEVEDEEEVVPNIVTEVKDSIKTKSIDKTPSPSKKLNNPSPIRNMNENTPNKQIDIGNPLEHLKDGLEVPDKFAKLKYIHGFNGGNDYRNLFILSNGELAFFVGAVAVLWNPDDCIQRLYTSHTNDINRMALRKSRNIIATSEEAGRGNQFAVVRVWSAKNLQTYAVLTQNTFGSIVTDMDFSIQGSLMVINSEDHLNLTVWEWKDSQVIASSRKELKNGESVKGSAFHKTEDDIMVTFGNKHLSVWQRRRDGTIDSRTAIKPESKAAKTITCVDFLPDHSLLSGDTTGTLTIWAPLEDENGVLEFVVKEVKGHDKSLTCLQLLQNNILITGDFEGTVKTWDVNDEQFRLLNAIKLPPTSGAIIAITMVHYMDKDNDAIEIYIGTSMNLILKGSALQATNYTVIFEGHSMAIRGLAVDPKYDFFYTSGLDQKICKWSESALIWRTTTETQCVSASVHPSGEVLAVGSVSGTIFIMNTTDGHIISQLPVSQVCIGCLGYSGDGDLLAAGCQDGVLYILPVLDNGYSYEKVSVLKGPFAILSLQWSIDNQFILTSVNESNYQELILWDLPNCRYMKGLANESDIIWFDPTCSGGEDVRGIWDNRYLQDVVNLSCHCSGSRKYLVSGDEEGYLRLFSYPCSDSKAAFFEYRPGGGSVTEVRFTYSENMLVSGNYSGALFVWQLMPFNVQ